jgi:hypothetical protein
MLELVDSGHISAQRALELALGYMSEDDVRDMMDANEIPLDDRDEED